MCLHNVDNILCVSESYPHVLAMIADPFDIMYELFSNRVKKFLTFFSLGTMIP